MGKRKSDLSFRSFHELVAIHHQINVDARVGLSWDDWAMTGKSVLPFVQRKEEFGGAAGEVDWQPECTAKAEMFN